MTVVTTHFMTEAGQQLFASQSVETPFIVAKIQAEAATAWLASPWPTRKTEAWKYTPLKAVTEAHFIPLNNKDVALTSAAKTKTTIADLNAIKLVFVDGVLDVAASHNLQNLPTGLTIALFNETTVTQKEIIAQHFNKAAGEHATLFGHLNIAATTAGVLIHIAKNTLLNQPVHVLHYAQSASAGYANARVLWVQELNSQATLVEQFMGENNAPVFTNSITELFVGDNAACEHYRLHLEDEANLHIGGVYSHLQKSSRLNSFYVAMGSNLQRVDVVTQFEGEGGEAINNGVYLPVNQQLTDFHTCIEHKMPHCTSNEIFRGIIGDSARAVFNGRIHIHRDAQKTLAELSNKNLLTSAKAEVNTKPELEIYADDVRCAHGATIAELDPLAMHYLRTRGISQAEAQVMLSFGFINELIEQLNNPAIKAYLKPVIAQRFAKEPALMQHLIG